MLEAETQEVLTSDGWRVVICLNVQKETFYLKEIDIYCVCTWINSKAGGREFRTSIHARELATRIFENQLYTHRFSII